MRGVAKEQQPSLSKLGLVLTVLRFQLRELATVKSSFMHPMDGTTDSDRPDLCDVCSTIDFASYFRPPTEGELRSENAVGGAMYKARKLGTGAEIRRKGAHCSFCDLAYTAMNTDGNDTTVSMSSYFCGNSRDIEGEDELPTYYILLRAASPNGQNVAYLQLLADDAYLLDLSTEFRARVPREAGFDMAQACRWLEICRTEHSGTCSMPRATDDEALPPQPVDLLAIDLVNMSICHMPFGSEYVALSYCWPAITYLTLLDSNREALFQHRALLNNMHKLPGTVRDAIECAQELPFRYLWIDALCIVQDDFEHKDKQLRQMDRVYSRASLTLVCAYPVARDEGDPCDGFPGLNKHAPDRARSVRLVQGLRLMVASPCIDNYLLSTRWEKRCW